MASDHHVEVGRSGNPHRGIKRAPEPEIVREECERILLDPLFSHSKRYSDLLKYIVDRTLDGQHDCLKERIIGIEVFGRTPDYNTNQDATVRVAITEVRKRLARYFEDPRHQNELRIDLPAGSYVAGFSFPSELVESRTGAANLRWIRYLYIGIPIVVVGLILGVWSTKRLGPHAPIEEFWAPVLNSPGTILISIGNPVSSTTDGPGGTPASTGPDLSLGQFIGQQSDFPVAELRAANAISSFLEQHGKKSVTRLAQTTALSDMRGAPTVILGSLLNQWAVRLGSKLRFQYGQTADGTLNWIEDTRDPENRRWATKLDSPYKQVKSEYALITRALDPTTGQWWIGIGGATVLGTLGAQQMILDSNTMEALNSSLPIGREHKNIQLVVEFKMVDGSLGAPTIVATDSW
jgi:hypothetical protein